MNQVVLAAGGLNKSCAEQDIIEVIRINHNGTVTKQNIEVDFSQGITEMNKLFLVLLELSVDFLNYLMIKNLIFLLGDHGVLSLLFLD